MPNPTLKKDELVMLVTTFDEQIKVAKIEQENSTVLPYDVAQALTFCACRVHIGTNEKGHRFKQWKEEDEEGREKPMFEALPGSNMGEDPPCRTCKHVRNALIDCGIPVPVPNIPAT